MKRWLALFCFGLLLWTWSWILLDWVLNKAVYEGMTEPFWLFQMPFATSVVYVTGWHAYQIAFIEAHIALIILIYAWVKLSTERQHAS